MNGKGDKFRGSLKAYREGWDRIFGKPRGHCRAMTVDGKPLRGVKAVTIRTETKEE